MITEAEYQSADGWIPITIDEAVEKFGRVEFRPIFRIPRTDDVLYMHLNRAGRVRPHFERAGKRQKAMDAVNQILMRKAG
jgi:hypothetical protein